MSDPVEIDVRVMDDPGIDPYTAFVKLRSYTPGRGCFLLQMPGHTIVGYRVRRGELMPPGVDAIQLQADMHGKEDAPETLAEALPRMAVGYFAQNNVSLRNKVQLFEDEGSSGQLAVECAAILWDHEAGTMHAAGRKKGNQAERIEWELTHEENIAPLEPPQVDASAVPDGMRTLVDEQRLAARAKRAGAFLGDELDSIVLAQMFFAPAGTSDPFDAYRAQRVISGAAHGFYVDFGESPTSPHVCMCGVSDTVLSHRKHGGEGSFADDIYDKLPDPAYCGSPTKAAMKLVRRLEDAIPWDGVQR